MKHLTLRVAWHDSGWTGGICVAPSRNAYCLVLDRIREQRDDAAEDSRAGASWEMLTPPQLPPCISESGGFMNPHSWMREFQHPYAQLAGAQATHGHLRPTRFTVPSYSTFAVPFSWMRRGESERIAELVGKPLPLDIDPPFPSPWIFGRERQEAILEYVFGQLAPSQSLVFFYTKEGQPVHESATRLLIGVGHIANLGPLRRYETSQGVGYPLWERLIEHTIRPDRGDGFLLPYHEYLKPTGDPTEDASRKARARDLAVTPDDDDIPSFSYGAEIISPDVTLSTLIRLLESIRQVQADGIAEGKWGQCEDWINDRIGEAWRDRGAFPGFGPALEAFGVRRGTAFAYDCQAAGLFGSQDSPWPMFEGMMRGDVAAPKETYKADLQAAASAWLYLDDQRKALLQLLSRFDLSTGQFKRWFRPNMRATAASSPVTDEELLANPYRITEVDLADEDDPAVSISVIDRGMLPDPTVVTRHPLPAPSRVESSNDLRRLRAALVTVLNRAAESGDSLLGAEEALSRVNDLRLGRAFDLSIDWFRANLAEMTGVVDCVEIPSNTTGKSLTAVQLSEVGRREQYVGKVLRQRAARELPRLKVEWSSLLKAAIEAGGGKSDPSNPRHKDALDEQVQALEAITTRRLSVLTGRAGTGKTSILGALVRSPELAQAGILLLAPTGKARVRLGRATQQETMTVAQFLYGLHRYDGPRQRPLFAGDEPTARFQTVIIDESSMLTLDDLVAVLKAIDLAHVQRVILVGDPNQLPPIGIGRPFADLVAYLDWCSTGADTELTELSKARARLTVELRTVSANPSDTLRLASWFTREPQPVDADRVLSDLQRGQALNDLFVAFWTTPEELRAQLLELLRSEFHLTGSGDAAGFNAMFGLDQRGWLPLDDPDKVETFQILSPVRMHAHGVHDLNRWLQGLFRGNELQAARRHHHGAQSLGDEEIVIHDKVIQVRNQWRDGYQWKFKKADKQWLANGEIGLMGSGKEGWLNALFSGRPEWTFGYRSRDFPGGAGPLELAYALTVHKAQGSDFGTVFVVIPQQALTLSRELLYTALTRSKRRMVLLLEGNDAGILYDLSRPERSETVRRNTNLFLAAIRTTEEAVPYAEHLIHRTLNGEMVRSKSELVIANMLKAADLSYRYERPLVGTKLGGRMHPDFSFTDAAGDVIIWEHLGMLVRPDYRFSWEAKRDWYVANGYIEGSNLFTTADDERGGLDSSRIEDTIQKVRALVE